MKRILICLALIAGSAQAQTAVINAPGGELKINASARDAGKTTEVLVDNTTVTLMPATALVNRKAVELQNLGPNPIYCTIGGETPLTTGALGRRVDANGGTWAPDIGPAVIIRCLAGTADQVTTAATQVNEIR